MSSANLEKANEKVDNNLHDERLLIVDFGSQYTQLIARRVRESGVYCEILPWDAPDEAFLEFSLNGVILSGSH